MSSLVKDSATSEVRRARPLASTRLRSALLGAPAFSLRIVAEEELDASVIEREFPSSRVEQTGSVGKEDVVIDDFAWRGSFDFCRFDEAIERADPLASIAIRGDDAVGVACEVMTRYQRLVPRRNRASATPLFDAVLEAHARLFDPSDPLAKSDHDHALDTWQWLLRIDPEASFPLQIAALLHDVDRLESEPHERIEHRARDREIAVGEGGDRSLALLTSAGVSSADAAREEFSAPAVEVRLEEAELRYQAFKEALLLEGAHARIDIRTLQDWLRLASLERRAIEQVAKAARMLAVLDGDLTPQQAEEKAGENGVE